MIARFCQINPKGLWQVATVRISSIQFRFCQDVPSIVRARKVKLPAIQGRPSKPQPTRKILVLIK
jgi:hypothetical protein